MKLSALQHSRVKRSQVWSPGKLGQALQNDHVVVDGAIKSSSSLCQQR